MKKARQFFGLILAIILSMSIFPTNLARADDFTNEKVVTITTENTKDKIEKIVNEYLQGIYDSEESINYRKELVSKYSLQDKVDVDYFYKEEYLNALIDDTTIGEKIVLVKLSKKGSSLDDVIEMTDSERSARIQSIISEVNNSSSTNSNIETNTLESSSITNASSSSFFSITPRIESRSISFAPSVGATVTNEQDNIMYYENGMLIGRTDKFNINGVIAFCADHSKEPPGTGVRVIDVRVETNSNIRKILYYGFSGPKQISGWDPDGLRAATSMAMSQVRNGDGMNLGRRLLNQVQGLAEPPAEFTAYMLTLQGSQYQQMAMWELKQVPKKGKLRIKKETSNLEVSRQNNYYTTNGAVYGVYRDAGATQKVAELRTTNRGWSDYIELDAGTYYLKELQAPEGFHISTNVESVVVEAGKTMPDKVVYDEPKNDPVALLINKVDSRTGQANPNLAGAEFTFKFYAGKYADGIDPATQIDPKTGKNVVPTRTWILRTNDKGQVFLADSNKVSGDAFYRQTNGNPTLPMGTLTMQETKAPDGYKINSQLIVKNIKPGNGPGGTLVSQTPTIKEDSVNFSLKKDQLNTGIIIPGAKFRYTNQHNQVSVISTDDKGEINLYGLGQGTHKIVEVDPTSGYSLNNFEVVFEVTADNKVVLRSDLTNRNMHWEDRNGNGYLAVGNVPNNYKLKIVKENNDNTRRLQGAEFTLYSDAGLQNVVERKTSNEHGEILFENLSPGIRYYIKETQSPDGFRVLDGSAKEIYVETVPVQDKFEFFVDGTKHTATNGNILIEGDKVNRVVGLVYKNDTVNLQLRKVQEGTDVVIPNAKFKHTKPDGSTEEITIGADGTLTLVELKRGRHKIVEIDPTYGYQLNANEVEFEVGNDNVVRMITDLTNKNMWFEDRGGNGFLQVANSPSLYSFRITKVNNHGINLEGAEFTLYDKDTNAIVQTVVTDTQGVATFTNLVPGKKYYYKETKSPEGYRIPLNKDGSEIVTEVYANAMPVQDKFSLYVNGAEHIASSQDGNIIIEGDKANRVAGMKVVNDVLMKLPETGSNMMIPLLLIGSFLMLSYICLSIKSQKKFKFNGGN